MNTNNSKSVIVQGKENNSEISNVYSQRQGYNKTADIQRIANYRKATKNLTQNYDYNNLQKPKDLCKINSQKPQVIEKTQNNNLKPLTIQHSQSLPAQPSQPTIRDFSVIDQSTQQLPKPAISQKEQDNFNLLQTYSTEILNHMKVTEEMTTPINCLERHEIPANLRAKMVDWMIEVLSSYKCTEQTFFLAVRLMDKYFEQCPNSCLVSELHLVGVTCMFIACKYEEIYPMKLQVVHDKISHKKLSVEAIKEKESQILSVINFNIVGSTPYELSIHSLFKTDLKERLEPKIYNYLQKICIYLSKMVLYDYELVKQRSYALLSGALIYVAFKIIEQIMSNFKVDDEIIPIKNLLNINHSKLIETAQKVLNLAKNFDKEYPQLENLKKFNGFSLDDDNQKQDN